MYTCSRVSVCVQSKDSDIFCMFFRIRTKMMVTKPMCLLRPAVQFGARRWHLQTPKRQLSRTPICLYKAVIFDMYGVLLPSPVKIFSGDRDTQETHASLCFVLKYTIVCVCVFCVTLIWYLVCITHCVLNVGVRFSLQRLSNRMRFPEALWAGPSGKEESWMYGIATWGESWMHKNL